MGTLDKPISVKKKKKEKQTRHPQQQHQPALGAALEQHWVGKGCVGWPWLDQNTGDICFRIIAFSFGLFKYFSPLEAQERMVRPAARQSILSGNSAANTRKMFHFTWGHLSILHKDRSPLECSFVQIQLQLEATVPVKSYYPSLNENFLNKTSDAQLLGDSSTRDVSGASPARPAPWFPMRSRWR